MIWYRAAVKYKSADLHVITCHLTIVQRNISAARLVSGGSTGGPKTTHNPIPQTKAASHKSPLSSTEDITSIPTRDLSNTPNLLGSETQHLTPLTFLLFHSPPPTNCLRFQEFKAKQPKTAEIEAREARRSLGSSGRVAAVVTNG